VSLNSVGINVSRAVGPALGGVITAGAGIAAPFWLNAASNLGVIGVLAWWRPPMANDHRLPPEHLLSALRVGLRHALYNPHLTATLIRAAIFFAFASAYWALLPLVARARLGAGAELYGFLVGAIGASAV